MKISKTLAGGSAVKNLPLGSRRSPVGGNGNPHQYSCLGNPIDRNLAGYSPWDSKKSDVTGGSDSEVLSIPTYK